MLNYAFPYNQQEVQEQCALMSRLLAEAINAGEGARRSGNKVRAYLEARQTV